MLCYVDGHGQHQVFRETGSAGGAALGMLLVKLLYVPYYVDGYVQHQTFREARSAGEIAAALTHQSCVLMRVVRADRFRLWMWLGSVWD